MLAKDVNLDYVNSLESKANDMEVLNFSSAAEESGFSNQDLQAEMNCCGTFGTLGSAGGCFGTFGTLGCGG